MAVSSPTASVCTAGRAGEALGVLRGCLGSLQTSTYQAVLTTDGIRSFALLLYQDGGMRWDYTKLAAANVLIGFSRCCTSVTGFWDSRDLFQHCLETVRGIAPRRAQLPLLEQPCPISTLSPANCSSSHPSCSMGRGGGLCWKGDLKPPLSTQWQWLCPKQRADSEATSCQVPTRPAQQHRLWYGTGGVFGVGGHGRSCVLCARSMSPAPTPGR